MDSVCVGGGREGGRGGERERERELECLPAVPDILVIAGRYTVCRYTVCRYTVNGNVQLHL